MVRRMVWRLVWEGGEVEEGACLHDEEGGGGEDEGVGGIMRESSAWKLVGKVFWHGGSV